MKLRFSLRSLFVIVTAVAAALGWAEWQRRIVDQRRQLIYEINQHQQVGTWATTGREPDEPSWLQKQFGDVSYILRENASEDLVRRTKYLFPNAYQMRGNDFHKLNDR